MSNHRVKNDVRVAMPDGETLATDIHFPVDESRGQWSVVLERTPYNRQSESVLARAARIVDAGVVYVVQDVCGRGDSTGVFELIGGPAREGQDGRTTIEWLHNQEWFDGNVMTVGGSLSAANQHHLALKKPDGLRSQILVDAGTNYYRRMFRNHGLGLVGANLPWAIQQALEAPEVRTNPADYNELRRFAEDPTAWASALPVRRGQSPLAQVPAYETIYLNMLDAGDDSPAWDNPMFRLENYWDDYPRDLSLLLVSGWYAHHCSANFDKLQQLGSRLDGPVRLVVGPWAHSIEMGGTSVVGDVDFGQAAPLFGDYAGIWRDWIGGVFGGEPSKLLASPQITYFLMGTGDGHKTDSGHLFHGGEWRASDVWPPRGTAPISFFLQSNGALETTRPSSWEGSVSWDFDPSNPTPQIGSNNLPSRLPEGFALYGPRNQRQLDGVSTSASLNERDDVVSFESQILVDDLAVVGPVAAEVWFSSTAPDTDLVVKLIDVHPPSESYPQGYELLISEGMQRLRYRDDRPMGSLMTPGEHYRINIELAPTANVFKRGHRMRVDLASALFPSYDVNPNTGAPVGDYSKMAVATQTVHLNRAFASRVVLQVMKNVEVQE